MILLGAQAFTFLCFGIGVYTDIRKRERAEMEARALRDHAKAVAV